MSFKKSNLDGFDELFDQYIENAKDLVDEYAIPFNLLFNPTFMSQNTNYEDFVDFFTAGKFDISNNNDIYKYDPTLLDCFVKRETNFETWKKMKESAAVEWINKSIIIA